MRVEITRSGGVGGFVLRRAVETADLSPEDADAVRHIIDCLPSLVAHEASAPEPTEADRFMYEIAVTDGQEPRQLTLDESRLTPAGRELVRQLWGLARPSN